MENCFRSHLGVPRITKILLTAVDNVCSTLPHLFDVTLSNHTNSIGYIGTTYTCVLHSGWRAFWMMMMHLGATCLQCRFSCMETIQQAYIPPLSPNYFSKGHVFLNTKDMAGVGEKLDHDLRNWLYADIPKVSFPCSFTSARTSFTVPRQWTEKARIEFAVGLRNISTSRWPKAEFN